MLQRGVINNLPLKPLRSAAMRMPEVSLHRRQLGQLAGVFRLSALAAEGELLGEQKQRWHGLGMLLVVAIHAVLVWYLFVLREVPIKPPEPLPMTVSLINLPAKKEEPKPEPEIVPVIEPKPVVKPVKKEKPVEKPIERPKPVVERIVEPAPEQPRFEASTEASPPPMAAPAAAAPAPAPVAPPAPAKQEVVEEKEEPPKFGVAYLNNPAPEYPKLSKRAGEEGRVLLKVLVSADGRPETVDIAKGSGFDRLDTAAVNAVKQWKFVPARKGNKDISAYVMVPLTFTLN